MAGGGVARGCADDPAGAARGGTAGGVGPGATAGESTPRWIGYGDGGAARRGLGWNSASILGEMKVETVEDGEAPHHHHRKQSAWTKYIYTMYSKLQSQLGSLIVK
uniref:DUF834 domain-containing protein n=1 Tax=Oryza glumipatula TaxID=40148 RepID=A0A0D9ZLY9_9ORYZ